MHKMDRSNTTALKPRIEEQQFPEEKNSLKIVIFFKKKIHRSYKKTVKPINHTTVRGFLYY